MVYLLDVNLLIALGDRSHEHHQRARAWFLAAERPAWATCPITENGFVRILGHPGYPSFSGGCPEAREVLSVMTSLPGHQFWEDGISVTDVGVLPELAGSKQLTDQYLLALAVARSGRFATLDERVAPGGVPGGSGAYFLVP